MGFYKKYNMSKANMTRQVINLKDGTTKNIFHIKLDSTRGDHKQWWMELNKTPNPESKTQQKKMMNTLEQVKEDTIIEGEHGTITLNNS